MATTTGGTALAERPTDSVWLSTLPTPRHATGSDTLPAIRPAAAASRVIRPAHGVLAGLPGAVTDLGLSADGRHLVAAHYGDDTVSVIDVETLSVTATVSAISEPYALATADRAYVRSASILEDGVVAVDLESGAALAAREVGVGAGGIAVSPAGDLLYVARSCDGVADIAVIDVESGNVSTIPVVRSAGVCTDVLRINRAGTRLYAALATATGGTLAVIDIRTGRVQAVAVGASIAEIAVPGDDRRVFVTGRDGAGNSVLHVVDTAAARVVHSAPVDGLPVGVLAAGGVVYLAYDEKVAILDASTLRVISHVEIGRPVSCVAISRDGSRLFVGDYDGAITALQAFGQSLRAAS
jgi:YVTN family beta-propeller protein